MIDTAKAQEVERVLVRAEEANILLLASSERLTGRMQIMFGIGLFVVSLGIGVMNFDPGTLIRAGLTTIGLAVSAGIATDGIRNLKKAERLGRASIWRRRA